MYKYGISIYIIVVSLFSMESNRQKKVARLIQKDLSEIFLKETKSIYYGFYIIAFNVF